jgi:hypothetical protein
MGLHVCLGSLYGHESERWCVSMPQTCQQVDGTADLRIECNMANMFEEYIKETQAIREAHPSELSNGKLPRSVGRRLLYTRKRSAWSCCNEIEAECNSIMANDYRPRAEIILDTIGVAVCRE